MRKLYDTKRLELQAISAEFLVVKIKLERKVMWLFKLSQNVAKSAHQRVL